MKQAHRDLIAGGTVAALAAAVLVVLPYQTQAGGGQIVTSASMPTWLAWALLILGLLLMVSGARRWRLQPTPQETPTTAGPAPQDAPSDSRWRSLAFVAAVIAIAILYAASLRWLGFPLASGLALAGLSYLFGARHWLTILGPAIVLPALIYVFFRYAMLVLLPTGRLFG